MSIWFVNVGHNPLASHADAGYQLISERVDALSFGAAHDCLVANVEHLYTTSWGEVRIERHPEGGEGLLNCLCRYLDLFAPQITLPGPIAAYSFSSTRGSAIANRVARLAQAIADAFNKLGLEARYLLRIADHYFQIHHRGDHFGWAMVGETADLEDHLAEATAGFVPTRIDRVSMKDSPLPTLLMRNEPGLIQVFYEPRERGIQLFVFTESGALFQQWVGGADEYHLLVQQQRFLDTVASRRILASAEGTADPQPQFARVTQLATGDWQVRTIQVPRSRFTDHTEMGLARSEERRVGQECRSRWSTAH